jgi:hypothetical protein
VIKVSTKIDEPEIDEPAVKTYRGRRDFPAALFHALCLFAL